MPTYCYTVDEETVEYVMTVAEMESRKNLDGTSNLPDGKIGKRDLFKRAL